MSPAAAVSDRHARGDIQRGRPGSAADLWPLVPHPRSRQNLSGARHYDVRRQRCLASVTQRTLTDCPTGWVWLVDLSQTRRKEWAVNVVVARHVPRIGLFIMHDARLWRRRAAYGAPIPSRHSAKLLHRQSYYISKMHCKSSLRRLTFILHGHVFRKHVAKLSDVTNVRDSVRYVSTYWRTFHFFHFIVFYFLCVFDIFSSLLEMTSNSDHHHVSSTFTLYEVQTLRFRSQLRGNQLR